MGGEYGMGPMWFELNSKAGMIDIFRVSYFSVQSGRTWRSTTS